MTVQHDTQAAIDFLRQWQPGGPWVLTAITLQKKTETRTFYENIVEQMRGWIEEKQGVHNVYFMVNPARRALGSKADKTDMAALAWLHVDIDPRAGEDIASERERALKLLQSYEPRPTVIVDSGGGFQGFWRLEEAQPIDGDVGRAEELEAYNQQLEIVFQADHCHNIDRIMRLPGTINVPDEKKLKKGRVPALAVLVEFNDRSYPLKRFTPAVRVQGKGLSIGGGGTKIKVSGNVQRLGTVDDLGEEVPQRVKMLIVQGGDPDDPTKYQSRSELLFYICCELVRHNIDDDTIFSVITDPDFGISASVLDKPRPEKYALRQIEQARENAIDPVLREFNEKHAVIGDDGGKCRIISIVHDHALGRERISRQSFDDFRNRYRHIKVQVGQSKDGVPEYQAAGAWWIDNRHRRQYETIVFAPGREIEGAFNLWTGFSCEAIPGDGHKRFLQHILDNVCGGSQETFDYVVRWMARCVQKPDEPGQVAIVLRGKMGTGKGFFIKTFGSLWGRHFLQVSDSKHLVGNFNSHLRDCVVLFGDEAFYAGDKKHEATLKALVTEETLAIEAKGVDVVASSNFVHLMLASNSDWVVPAAAEERRFLVLDVSANEMQNNEYFKSLRNELEGGGRENLLYYLMSLDISEFEVRKVPKTQGLRDQKQHSFSPEQTWMYEKLNDGQLLPREDRWVPEVVKDELHDDYLQFMQRHGYFQKRSAPTVIGKFLSKVFGADLNSQRKWVTREFIDSAGFSATKKEYKWMYKFPSLQEARAAFDANCGGPFDWQPIMENSDAPSAPTKPDNVPF